MISLWALDLFIRFTLLRRCIAVFQFQQHLSVAELNWITDRKKGTSFHLPQKLIHV